MKKSPEERFWSKVDIKLDEECWIWKGAKLRGGYGNIKINGKTIQAHRYSYMLFYDVDIAGYDVLHICDNPSCVNPVHLFLGDDVSNSKDRVAKNRQTKGEDHPHSKLTAEDVIRMRNTFSFGQLSMHEIAKLFEMSYAETNAILHRRTWRHV